MSWSPCGRYLATFCKDGTLALYEPRNSTHPIREGCGPEGRRGGRIVWLDAEHIIVTGFIRQVYGHLVCIRSLTSQLQCLQSV